MRKRLSTVFLGVFGLIIALNIWGFHNSWRLDLTEDKRFTLSKAFLKLIDSVQDNITVQVYLDGELPAMFTRLRQAIDDDLQIMHRRNPKINYFFTDPSAGDIEVVNNRHKELAEQGLTPYNLNIHEENTQKRIYPYAVVKYGPRKVYINLLETDRPGVPGEETILESIALLEYKFANAFQKIFQERKKNIVFTRGHDELNPQETSDLENELSAYYNITRVNLDSIYALGSNIDLLIIAKPRSRFADKEKFIIDQYIMNGGPVLFLLDALEIDNLQLQQRGMAISYALDSNLEDLLFRFGVRLQPNFVLDVESSKRPAIVGKVGNQNQFKLLPWYFDLVPPGNPDHEITGNINRVNLIYASSLDTIKTKTPIRKYPLLQSSDHSRLLFHPVEVSTEIMGQRPDPALFNQPKQNLAILLEGEFESLYKNRLSSGMQRMLDSIHVTYKESIKNGQIIVVGDGDIAKNLVNVRTGETLELGYNAYENFKFANKPFLLNTIEYLTSEKSLIFLKNKELKIHLLDKEKIKNNRFFWTILNLVFPVLCIWLIYGIFWAIRRKRYG